MIEISFLKLSKPQETLLTINNADEGSIFVNPSFVENQTLSEYISNLIFTLDEAQVQTATSLYERVSGGIVIQANTAMAECENIPHI